MDWKKHPTKKDTKNRRARKGARSAAFFHNKGLRAKLNREKRALHAS